MRYYSRAGIYKASNVIYNPTTEVATSYDWWQFVRRINGVLVFNNYYYSQSTSKHQAKVRALLEIEPDLVIESPEGLQDLDSAIEHYERKIQSLQSEIARPRTQKKKNLERMQSIDNCKLKIKQIKEIKES